MNPMSIYQRSMSQAAQVLRAVRKVSVASTRVAGMTDFTTVPYSHPFIMERDEVIALAVKFIATGTFED